MREAAFVKQNLEQLPSGCPTASRNFAIAPGFVLQRPDVLRQYGNMSSPTILFVLKQIFERLNEDNDGDEIFSLAFGPGLTLESIIFEVQA